MTIRRLTPNDAPAFRALWLDGLARFPAAFLLTLDEGQQTTTDSIARAMSNGTHWGAFDTTDTLIALGVLRRGGVARLHHTGDIGPFYVHPDAQAKGTGRALLHAMLTAARADGLLQVELCVDTTNTAAIRLYESAGFTSFGLRPRSVILNGTPRDDALMLKRLDT